MKTKELENHSLRRFGGRGLLLIVIVLLLCVFFSGTVRTLTTAKVRVASVSSGRLQDTIRITGYLRFDETEELPCPELPQGLVAEIGEVWVQVGQYVATDTPLFGIHVKNLDDRRKSLISDWQDNETRLLLRQRTATRVTRQDETWFDAYTELMAARESLLTLTNETSSNRAAAEARLTSAEESFALANRHPIGDSAFEYLSDIRELKNRKAALEAEIVSLQTIFEEITVRAGHAGYITEVCVEENGDLPAGKKAITMSLETSAVSLRGMLNEKDRPVAEGVKATVKAPNGDTIRSTVTQTGSDRFGTPWADVSLKDSDLTRLGNKADLMSTGIGIELTYTSEETTLLIPVTALRGNSFDRYVYIVTESEDIFGSRVLRITKQPVTLSDQSADTAAIGGILPNTQVAYMEDRALTDGAEVMIYGSVP